jgi:hypothetical protein
MANSTATLTPKELAQQAADRYFDAIGTDLPFDTAPGDVNLLEAATEIADALRAFTKTPNAPDTVEDCALRAGYLLGVEVGRRLAYRGAEVL